MVPPHHRRIVDFTPDRTHAHPRKGKSTSRGGKPRSRVIKVLGKDDQLVECFKPVNQPAWMSDAQWEALPQSITLREVRRIVKRNGFRPIVVTIVTTLLDAQAYPADELIELRLTRLDDRDQHPPPEGSRLKWMNSNAKHSTAYARSG